MKTFLGLVLIIASSLVEGQTVPDLFRSYEVVPDYISTAPNNVADVQFTSSGVRAWFGNQITPYQARHEPVVTWRANSNQYYTVAMIDRDVPSRESPTGGPLAHWLVGNIPGNYVNSGEVLAAYIGPGAPKGTGLHRYVVLVYQQPGHLTFDEPRIPNTTAENRAPFHIEEFARKYNLGNPIAGNFFQAQYDDYVPTLHKQIGF